MSSDRKLLTIKFDKSRVMSLIKKILVTLTLIAGISCAITSAKSAKCKQQNKHDTKSCCCLKLKEIYYCKYKLESVQNDIKIIICGVWCGSETCLVVSLQ